MRTGITLGVVALSGCETYGDIEPAPTAPAPAPGEPGVRSESTVEQVQNIEVIASSESWPGDAVIREEVTPFRVHIDNDSMEHDVRVDYSNIYLLNSKGERYQALPPFKVEGDAPTPRMGMAYNDVSPGWYGSDFYLYDPYDPLYVDYYDVYDGYWDYNPDYYRTYYGYWGDRDLPTPRMLSEALPEGVVRAGGEAKGWVYFEEIDAGDDDMLEFRADLVDADSGRRIGQVSMPFYVEEL